MDAGRIVAEVERAGQLSERELCSRLGRNPRSSAVAREVAALLASGGLVRNGRELSVPNAPAMGRCVTCAGFEGRVLVVPDVHAPCHSKPAWDCAVAAARILRPDAVVIIGDFVDNYAASSHSKDPSRRLNVAWELDQALELLRELTDAVPPARKWYLEGNHESRLDRYVADRAPELHGSVTTIPERLRLAELGWTWVPSQSYLRLGKMSFAHGWRCGKYALQATVSEWGGCITVGHTHRLGVHYSGDVRGDDHVGLNVGWLGDVESIDYRLRATAERDWQHGFGVVEIEPDGTAFAHAVPIIGGRTRIGTRRVP